jgi:hypothetical protein
MCLTQVYEIDCDALICGPLLWPGQIGPAQMQFCQPARCSATSGATAGRLGPGPGRRVRTALDIPATPAESRGRLVPVPLSRMAGRPFPVTPPRLGPVPRSGASVQVSAIAAETSRPATSAPGQSHGPVRPGAVWCSGWGTDLTWQDRTRPPSPRRPGERGMRNGNVPRRSTHPLEVFPRVQ